MGNKRNRIKKYKTTFFKHLRLQVQRMQEIKRLLKVKLQPKRLAVLCERVIKKYKLSPNPVDKAKLEPTSYTVVGGKPLRERKVKVKEDPVKKPKAVRKPKEIKKAELLDKPPTGKITEKLYFQIPTKQLPGTKTFSEPMNTIDTEHGPARIKEEAELNLPIDTDPLSQDLEDNYTVEIKEEIFDIEVQEVKVEVPDNPQTPRSDIIIPILIPSLNPGQPSTSSAIATNLSTMTVICDDIQIFANSIAEQLRALPVNRALLLQLDIQSMLDNERQLIMDES